MTEKLNNSKIEGELVYKELFTIDYYFDLSKVINNNFNYVFFILDNITKKFKFYSFKQKYRIFTLKNKIVQKELKMFRK